MNFITPFQLQTGILFIEMESVSQGKNYLKAMEWAILMFATQALKGGM